MDSPSLTGPELETLGLMKFACDACKNAFPARCGEHRVLVLVRVEDEPEPPKLELLLRQRAPERRILAYGKPIPEYGAPYEYLVADISDTLRAQRG